MWDCEELSCHQHQSPVSRALYTFHMDDVCVIQTLDRVVAIQVKSTCSNSKSISSEFEVLLLHDASTLTVRGNVLFSYLPDEYFLIGDIHNVIVSGEK
jgi:hypothetical protein